MDGDADTAAHGDAADERDVGFGEMLHRGIQPIFGGEEFRRAAVAPFAHVIDGTDIAAGAEGAPRHRIDHTNANGRIVRPSPELVEHRGAHLMRQRVQRMGPVQRDMAKGAFAAKDQVVGFHMHR